MKLTCFICEKEVDPNDRTLFFQITGWERKGFRQQGGSDISLRKRTGLVACNSCIALEKSGINPNQQTLV